MKAKDLEEKKVAELREYARKLKVPKYSRMRKDELIEKIISASGSKSAKPLKTGQEDAQTRIRGLSTERLSKSDESLFERMETETRLKMKEAFSSQDAQKEYLLSKEKQTAQAQRPHVHDKFQASDLPFEYRRNRITLLVIDPSFFYTYWEITNEKMGEGRKIAGWDSNLTLRVYDVTDVDFNGSNAHSFADVEVFERIGCWYVRLDRQGRNIVADIGLKSSSGLFYVLSRSNYAKLPPLHMAGEGPIKWMAVDDLGNFVITDIEEYTEADLILLRKILGEDLFRRFMTGEFKGMLFSTIFKKIPDLREISLEFPSSPVGKPPSSRNLNY